MCNTVLNVPQAPEVWTIHTKVWTVGLKRHTYHWSYKVWTDTPIDATSQSHHHLAVWCTPSQSHPSRKPSTLLRTKDWTNVSRAS